MITMMLSLFKNGISIGFPSYPFKKSPCREQTSPPCQEKRSISPSSWRLNGGKPIGKWWFEWENHRKTIGKP